MHLVRTMYEPAALGSINRSLYRWEYCIIRFKKKACYELFTVAEGSLFITCNSWSAVAMLQSSAIKSTILSSGTLAEAVLAFGNVISGCFDVPGAAASSWFVIASRVFSKIGVLERKPTSTIFTLCKFGPSFVDSQWSPLHKSGSLIKLLSLNF